jgi:hypothetical protein
MTANEESGVTYHYIKHAVTFKKMVTTWKEHVGHDGLELRRKGEPPPSVGEASEDPISQIERLGELVKKGLLSKEEFEAKKKELLDEVR